MAHAHGYELLRNVAICSEITRLKQIRSEAILAHRMKALEWLGNYFSMNPMDKHRIEFEDKDRLRRQTERNHAERKNRIRIDGRKGS